MTISYAIIVFCAVISASSAGKIYMHLKSAERVYSFFPMKTDYVEFQIKAPREIHIALTAWPHLDQTYNQYYEILLGGGENGALNIIRRGRDSNVVASNEGVIVDQNDFVTYWVQKNNTEGSIEVGKGKGTASILSFVDPEYVKTNYFGASTGQGVDSTWIINTNFLDDKD